MVDILERAGGPDKLIAVLALLAIPVILLAGSDQWFYLDEFALVADEGMPDLTAALDDHNGHWVTLPRLWYYAAYSVVGLKSYLPYQVLVVLTHVTVVLLSYLVSRRAGVGGWMAAAVAAALLLLGSGSMNLVYGLQISLNGSLLFGLTQLLLADHDGPVDRRDWFGLAAALIGLTTSAVMVPMLLGIGVAVLFRRGWRVAAFHAGIPLGLFLIWYLRVTDSPTRVGGAVGETARFFIELAVAPFFGLGQHAVTGVLLVGVVLFAIVGLVKDFWTTRDRPPLTLPAALVVAWLAFCVATTLNRTGAVLPTDPSAERYIHVGAVLLSPLIALGAWRLSQIRPALGWAMIVVLALGVPGNIQAMGEPKHWRGNEGLTVAVANSQFIDEVPRGAVPIGLTNPFFRDANVTAGWLRDQAAAGRLPDPDGLTARQRLLGDLTTVTMRPPVVVQDPPCELMSGTLETTVSAGDVVVYQGDIVLEATNGGDSSGERRFAAVGPAGQSAPTIQALEILAGPIEIRVAGSDGGEPMVCIG